jgi:hypothetical protein
MIESLAVNSNVTVLRERLTRFLANHANWKIPLRSTLGRIQENSWRAVIFGGVLRDLVVFGNTEIPRDIDVVISDANTRDLEAAFGDLILSKNRFGGFRLRSAGWLIDMWALGNTWAFRERLRETISFESLVHTTFLNVEAIAAEIQVQPGHPRTIYSAGFFESLNDKVLDINFEPNPNPDLCIVRSITMALRLNWSISRRLGTYIVEHASSIPLERLTAIHESHYRKVRIRQTRMLEYFEFIDRQLQVRSSDAIKLPATEGEQLALWKYWSPTC